MLSSRQDQVLVEECIRGNQEAWSALIDKYKNLIYSIPIKRGLSPENAADVFQSVCVSLVSELRRLREPSALAAWLIQTTSHKSLRITMEMRRYADGEPKQQYLAAPSPTPEELVREVEREQMVREAVAELSSECKLVVEALFYRTPPATYDDIAAALAIPKGSVGPTRMRCLDKVRRLLEERHF